VLVPLTAQAGPFATQPAAYPIATAHWRGPVGRRILPGGLFMEIKPAVPSPFLVRMDPLQRVISRVHRELFWQ
jgi:hypothetical protein